MPKAKKIIGSFGKKAGNVIQNGHLCNLPRFFEEVTMNIKKPLRHAVRYVRQKPLDVMLIAVYAGAVFKLTRLYLIYI